VSYERGVVLCALQQVAGGAKTPGRLLGKTEEGVATSEVGTVVSCQ